MMAPVRLQNHNLDRIETPTNTSLDSLVSMDWLLPVHLTARTESAHRIKRHYEGQEKKTTVYLAQCQFSHLFATTSRDSFNFSPFGNEGTFWCLEKSAIKTGPLVMGDKGNRCIDLAQYKKMFFGESESLQLKFRSYVVFPEFGNYSYGCLHSAPQTQACCDFCAHWEK